MNQTPTMLSAEQKAQIINLHTVKTIIYDSTLLAMNILNIIWFPPLLIPPFNFVPLIVFGFLGSENIYQLCRTNPRRIRRISRINNVEVAVEITPEQLIKELRASESWNC